VEESERGTSETEGEKNFRSREVTARTTTELVFDSFTHLFSNKNKWKKEANEEGGERARKKSKMNVGEGREKEGKN